MAETESAAACKQFHGMPPTRQSLPEETPRHGRIETTSNKHRTPSQGGAQHSLVSATLIMVPCICVALRDCSEPSQRFNRINIHHDRKCGPATWEPRSCIPSSNDNTCVRYPFTSVRLCPSRLNLASTDLASFGLDHVAGRWPAQ